MAEGHIEFILSVCLCVPDSCPTHNSIMHGGILKNHLAQMIIRQDDVSRVRTMSLGQRSRSQLALKVFAF